MTAVPVQAASRLYKHTAIQRGGSVAKLQAGSYFKAASVTFRGACTHTCGLSIDLNQNRRSL